MSRDMPRTCLKLPRFFAWDKDIYPKSKTCLQDICGHGQDMSCLVSFWNLRTGVMFRICTTKHQCKATDSGIMVT